MTTSSAHVTRTPDAAHTQAAARPDARPDATVTTLHPELHPELDPKVVARAALKSRHSQGLSKLLEERDDLRGVHALADFVHDSVRWTA